MNIVFSSDKKEYNTIKKGTEILLAENDGFNQNIELFVKFQDRPEVLINKRKNQIHIICREISHYYRALNYAIHHMEEDEFQYQSMSVLKETVLCWIVPEMLYLQLKR